MLKKYSAYLSSAALLAAVLVWFAVGLLARTVYVEKQARASNDFNTGYMSAAQDASLRLRALARDTREERALLDRIARADITHIVDTIEGAGPPPLKRAPAPPPLGEPPPTPASALFFLFRGEGPSPPVGGAARLLASL